MRKAIAIITALLVCVISYAQKDSSEFRVKSFRKLEWDLDAQVSHPMMDQNNKKAALIKVVTAEPDFDFDVGIMGVVEVRRETGEFWVYVPEHIKGITIRHPKFGIIRNYTFSIPIESASVYELVLATPKKELEKTVIVRDSIVYVTLPAEERKVARKRKSYDVNILQFFECPINNGIMSFGLISAVNGQKFGLMAKFGYYGNDAYTKLNATIGGTLKCGNKVRLCAGAGYGGEKSRTDDSNIDGYLQSGIEVNTGAIFNFGMFSLYSGVSTIQFKHYYGNIGIGIRFKTRSGGKK